MSPDDHVLAHEYREIRLKVLYRIGTVCVPELIPLLEPLIPAIPPEGE
jgi:hypothetical protein